MGFREWFGKLTGRPDPAPTPPPTPPVPAAPTEADILHALDHVVAMVSGGAVPAPISSRVKRIAETIRGYTRLPRQWADSRPIENGKTSLMLLIDQLDLLGATMDEIFDAVVRVDADALIAHGRFLQEKFGQASTGGMLNLGDPPAQQPRSNLDLP